MAYITYQPSDYFNTVLYTGNGSTQSITGVGFQPDWCWIKGRGSSAYDHQLFDAVRGATKAIASNDSAAEATQSNSLTSFDSDGFSLGDFARTNSNSDNKVSWNWKANGAGSANSDGNASNVTVSADATRGFSIVKFDVSTSIKTIGHGLGVAPEVIVMKQINGTTGWIVGSTYTGWNKYIMFQSTNAASTETRMFYPNSNNPTSSVWETEGSAWLTPSTGTAIAYCFASKKGFSKFGSYSGNGSTDGTFVYTGFKPAFVIIKRTDGTDSWFMYDNKRSSFNVVDDYLTVNGNGAEATSSAVNLDLLSNGFKLRNTDGGHNNSSGTYFYMAFAEEPLVSSNNVPATAR